MSDEHKHSLLVFFFSISLILCILFNREKNQEENIASVFQMKIAKKNSVYPHNILVGFKMYINHRLTTLSSHI
jgi:hypothetical protein